MGNVYIDGYTDKQNTILLLTLDDNFYKNDF